MSSFPADVRLHPLEDIVTPGRGTFAGDAIRRPPTSPSPRGVEDDIKYFALTDEDAQREGDAVGVAIRSDSVVVAVAIFDVQRSLSETAFAEVWKTSKQAVRDFFYCAEWVKCNFDDRRCRNGSACKFYHPSRDGPIPPFVGHAARTTPPELRKQPQFGLQKTAPSFAIVMQATFDFCPPFLVENVHFQSPRTVTFVRDAVQLHAAWTDTTLADPTLFSKEKEIVKRFCDVVSRVPQGQTFETLFSPVFGVKEPQAKFVDQRWVLNLSRDSFSVRRFLTDVTLDYFNQQAIAFLAARDRVDTARCASMRLLGKRATLGHQTIERAQEYFDDLSSLPSYELGRHHVSARMVLPAMQTTLVYSSVAEASTPSTGGVISHYKFTSPIRDFVSLHNLSVLSAAIDASGQLPPPQLSENELTAINKRHRLIEEKERKKVEYAMSQDSDNKSKASNIAVRLDDSHVLLLHDGVVAPLAMCDAFLVIPRR